MMYHRKQPDPLRRWAGRRTCSNCTTVYSDDVGFLPCAQCERNPLVKDMWTPKMPTAKEIVLFYVEQRAPISAPEIADSVRLPVRIISDAIVALMNDGKLKTETGVVAISKTRKKGTP